MKPKLNLSLDLCILDKMMDIFTQISWIQNIEQTVRKYR